MSTIERADTEIQKDLAGALAEAGLQVAVKVEDGAVTLGGIVLSEEEREAATDLAGFIYGVTRVVNNVELMDLEEGNPNVLMGMPTRPQEWQAQFEALADYDSEPDQITTSDHGKVGDGWTTDARVSVEEGISYFPPTDPPVDISDDPEGIEVASGFQSTSVDDNLRVRRNEAVEPGMVVDTRDAEIVDNVVRELNEDAATTQLNIHVASVGGRVFLTGYVSHPVDADVAGAVADRVDGVGEVIDRLVVGERPVSPRRLRIPRSTTTDDGRVAVPSPAWRSTVARNERWLARERDKVESQLQERREDLASFGRDQADEGTISNHQGDIASDVASADILNSEIVSLEDELNAIDEARLMIEDERYGICIVCGRLIDPARLRAFPLARRCIEDQEAFDNYADAALQAGQRRGV